MGYFVAILLLVAISPQLAAQEVPPPPSPPPRPLVTPVGPPSLQRPLPLPSEAVSIQRYDLKPGWNLVSFPLASVLGVRGFSELTNGQGERVSTQDLVAGKGYWVYSQGATRALAWGPPAPEGLSKIGLQPGWNLLGTCTPQQYEWSQLLCRDATGELRPLALSMPDWVGPAVYGSKGRIQPEEEGATMVPGLAYWVYARMPLDLEFVPSDRQLRIQAFQKRPDGRLALQVENLPQGSWTIRPRDPVNACSDFASDGAWLTFRAQDPEASFYLVAQDRASGPFRLADFRPSPQQLQLEVVSEDGEPVSRVQVSLGGKLLGTTDRAGRISLAEVGEKPPVLSLSRPGFLRRQVKVPLGKAARQRQKVQIFSPRTSLWFRVFPSSDGFRATRIDVYRKHDFSERLWMTYTFDQAEPYIDFTWYQCRAHLNYVIEITWTDAQRTERWHRFERRLPANGLQEYIYDYWTTR